MKKIIFMLTLLMFVATTGIVYSARGGYQVVEVYVCEEGVILANMLAQVTTNRKELYTVSYCSCEGVEESMRSEVTKTPCDPPKDMVYSCLCVGKNSY